MSLSHKVAGGLAGKYTPILIFNKALLNLYAIAKYSDRINKITERLNDLHVSI